MTSETPKEDPEEEFKMRDCYDFSNAMPDPYVQRFQELNLLSLDDDVKAAFPDSRAVNEASRGLMNVANSVLASRK